MAIYQTDYISVERQYLGRVVAAQLGAKPR